MTDTYQHPFWRRLIDMSDRIKTFGFVPQYEIWATSREQSLITCTAAGCSLYLVFNHGRYIYCLHWLLSLGRVRKGARKDKLLLPCLLQNFVSIPVCRPEWNEWIESRDSTPFTHHFEVKADSVVIIWLIDSVSSPNSVSATITHTPIWFIHSTYRKHDAIIISHESATTQNFPEVLFLVSCHRGCIYHFGGIPRFGTPVHTF